MEKITHDVGDSASIKVKMIGGDLRVSGRDEATLEVQAPEKGRLQVERSGDEISIQCRSGCIIFAPQSARLNIEQVGGDARITGISNDVFLRTVGGDLSIRRLGSASFEMVGGDVRARKVNGDLSIDRVGGDVALERVIGKVTLRSVGGDIYLTRHEGGMDVSAGGDAVVNYLPAVDSDSTVQAGGDLSCTLQKGASVSVKYLCGGDLHLPSQVVREEDDQRTIVIGEGKALLDLSAGGDLWIRRGEAPDDSMGGFDSLEVITEIDAKIAEMEAQFDALGAGLHGFDAKRIGEKVRRSVAKAQRKAARAEKIRLKHEQTLFGREAMQAPSEEERLTILKMVEDGKISVTEAEELLKALEGGG